MKLSTSIINFYYLHINLLFSLVNTVFNIVWCQKALKRASALKNVLVNFPFNYCKRLLVLAQKSRIAYIKSSSLTLCVLPAYMIAVIQLGFVPDPNIYGTGGLSSATCIQILKIFLASVEQNLTIAELTKVFAQKGLTVKPVQLCQVINSILLNIGHVKYQIGANFDGHVFTEWAANRLKFKGYTINWREIGVSYLQYPRQVPPCIPELPFRHALAAQPMHMVPHVDYAIKDILTPLRMSLFRDPLTYTFDPLMATKDILEPLRIARLPLPFTYTFNPTIATRDMYEVYRLSLPNNIAGIPEGYIYQMHVATAMQDMYEVGRLSLPNNMPEVPDIYQMLAALAACSKLPLASKQIADDMLVLDQMLMLMDFTQNEYGTIMEQLYQIPFRPLPDLLHIAPPAMHDLPELPLIPINPSLPLPDGNLVMIASLVILSFICINLIAYYCKDENIKDNTMKSTESVSNNAFPEDSLHSAYEDYFTTLSSNKVAVLFLIPVFFLHVYHLRKYYSYCITSFLHYIKTNTMNFLTYLITYIKNNHLILCALPVVVCSQIENLCTLNTPPSTTFSIELCTDMLALVVWGVNSDDSPEVIASVIAYLAIVIPPEQIKDLIQLFTTFREEMIPVFPQFDQDKMAAYLDKYFGAPSSPPSTIKYLMLSGIALSAWGLLYCAYVYSEIPMPIKENTIPFKLDFMPLKHDPIPSKDEILYLFYEAMLDYPIYIISLLAWLLYFILSWYLLKRKKR